MTNGWKTITILAVLAAGGASAAPIHEANAREVAAESRQVHADKFLFVGYVQGDKLFGTVSRNDSDSRDQQQEAADRARPAYDVASEPSFPGME